MDSRTDYKTESFISILVLSVVVDHNGSNVLLTHLFSAHIFSGQASLGSMSKYFMIQTVPLVLLFKIAEVITG